MAKHQVSSLFDAPPDIPLTLGDLVSRSFRAFRHHAVFVTKILFWPTVWSTISITLMKLLFYHWASLHSLQLDKFFWHGLGVVTCIGILAFAQFELSVRSVALLRVAASAEQNSESSLAYARRRKWAAVLLYNLAVLAPLVVIGAFAAIGAVAMAIGQHIAVWNLLSPVFFFVLGLASTLTVCYCILFTSLAFAVLACEDLTLAQITRRTGVFVSRYFWRGGSYLVLLGVTLLLVSIAVELPIIVASFFDSFTHNFSADRMTYEEPLYLQIMSSICDSILNIILLGVGLVAEGFFYNDILLRMEGRDISNRVARLS